MAKRDIPKAYDPGAIEPRWAERWVDEQLYTPEVAARQRPPDKGVYSLAIAPPNVTGSLHMGHMLEHTQVDILLRWRRMQGYKVLWLPGTDHASIAVHVLLERELAEQGLTRQQLGREEFLRRAWQWKAESGGQILKQMTRLGASCDWTRECFTMDKDRYRAVMEAFLRLYHEGLIYRGRYMINWCPRCHTALSDLEVEHAERDARLYYIKYPVPGTGYLVVATTRPETMLGDTGVAVHPEDDRYQKFVGKKARLPLLGRELPVLADSYVAREFGTGVVKITPAHDPNDFELGKRHQLLEIDVMDEAARINQNGGPYAGLDRFEARKRVLADLEAQGLLEKTEPYRHAVGGCQRCKTAVEPRISLQWFCRMNDPQNSLARPAIEVVQNGTLKIVPENIKKIYLNWMENLRDWCVSRQLWWGHRIPVWHCRDCGGLTPAKDSAVEIINGRPQIAHPPDTCRACGGANLTQDPDVLDTWFSSALWPFSTLGWPDETADLREFYPTTLMNNGFDILFFWDARMIMTGLHFIAREKLEDRVPFRTLYIHALVRDPHGTKMSKTRGNVVDPLEIIEEYGTDACRFTLAIMAAPGTDIALSPDRLRSYRAFANKIWNAARFIFLNLQTYEQTTGRTLFDLVEEPFPWPGSGEPFPPNVTRGRWERLWPFRGGRSGPELADRAIYVRYMDVVEKVNLALQGFRFHEAAHEIYHFFWHDFCDWYLELVKPRLFADSGEPNVVAFQNLLNLFEESLRLLHPFMPFITEELWQQLPHRYLSIALAPYPEPFSPPLLEWKKDAEDMELFKQAIVALRNIRAERKIDLRRKLHGELASTDAHVLKLFHEHRDAILRLANLSQLDLHSGTLPAEGGGLRHTARFDARIPLTEADLKAEASRLRKQKQKLEKELGGMRARLADRDFRTKAPDKVIRDLEQRQADCHSQYKKISAQLSRLENRLAGAGQPREAQP